jgi:hypothetical protein
MRAARATFERASAHAATTMTMTPTTARGRDDRARDGRDIARLRVRLAQSARRGVV